MPIEHIRISKEGENQLLKLKRMTGIKNWNVLCRWAFCVSLAELTKPSDLRIAGDSNVEMTWKTFGGKYSDIYFALLKERCKKDGLELTDDELHNQFKLHLHRGIGYLAADKNIKSISDLIKRTPIFDS